MPHDLFGNGVDGILSETIFDDESVNDGVNVDVHGKIRRKDDVPVMHVLKHSWELNKSSLELEVALAAS